MMKWLLLGGVTLTLAACAASGARTPQPDRARFVGSLFSGQEQYENFARIGAIFPTAPVTAPAKAFQFPEGARATLPPTFNYEGQPVDTAAFLSETDTAALLVLKDGKVRYEHYALSGGRNVRWLSMSVAKSFISALVGIAVEEGHIKSIEDPITRYLPELAGSAYQDVRIKDVLQMSSGASWNENYGDPQSDVSRLGMVMARGGSFNSIPAGLKRDHAPGTFNRYNSAETQVLGMLLKKATGRSIASYMTEKLWQPLGAETNAAWVIDDTGMEMAFAGLTATARDYAKLGELYRLRGNWHGRQIIPAKWVEASVSPDAPHLMPGARPNADSPMGYGYQWWVPAGSDGEFSAIGVYNQFIYVNPSKNIVIVKLSANSDYAQTNEEKSFRELETIELFRAIGTGMREP
ncbi:serine hydrolase [Sphingomonas sp. S-NIH.Pt3_0716]|nr:serine hydrolase [Sphingomonas sp. S-NIH.Pt3_0716]